MKVGEVGQLQPFEEMAAVPPRRCFQRVEINGVEVAADEAFHQALIRLADHDLLLASWRSLYMRVHQIMALRNRDESNLEEIAGNHPPIVQALANRDAERAIRLVSEHTRALADFDPDDIVQAV